MITFLIVYIIGFFLVPIVLIILDKKFKGSMNIDCKGSLLIALFACSFLWPSGLLGIFFLLYLHWHK